ncbi:hypothetical protein BDU57DRAFT_508862 [Ampelomyces quisqualis]|uniref:Uncharacterized protein n=1 Tax=Ampelomyces quisqualis TaxID=50730 RepID=A0A6A5R358_AMPQU|nr:hypothetical protein BDU57DRAFT_508862 [Ampelomyces quisqualis]
MSIGGFLISVGLFVYGWTVTAQTHLIAPLIATGLIGIGLLKRFMLRARWPPALSRDHWQ